ncbi:MAG: hypothetical protein R2796_05445 [Chitinophagaceae bacterium]|nr:hypothetical protein [Chitinophagaceae bacterium]MCB0741750.1 hypothetical protein [Chitinophagaceae bacterium]HQU56885.1 hypothetical protein [Chitinophagaceae bacterium]
MKTYLSLLLMLIPFWGFTQYDYEPSAEHPFGLPNPKAPEQINDFQPMIGICDCMSTTRNKDQTWNESIPMTWTFKYIMNGTAVQDETLKSDGLHSGSLRQYNADSAKWYVHYYASASANASLPTWWGGKKGDKIILYKDQTAPNGTPGFYRLSFYDLSDNGFKWIGEWVSKDESFVFPTWKIECTKRK